MNTFEPKDEQVGQRLDQVVAEVLGISRSTAKKSVQDGLVQVNERPGKASQRLEAGQTVAVDDQAIAEQSPTAPPPQPELPLTVIHEDDHLLVINKPSGQNMHPAHPGEEDTLVNALLARYPEIAAIGESVWRPGIMQRLDKEASGVVVIARTAPAYEHLKEQFQRHNVLKEYLALVNGQPSKDSDTIKLAVGRSSAGNRMAARPASGPNDRSAVTHYWVRERFAKASLVKVKTETGRTHQIRVHFQAIGHPLIGDRLYGKKNDLTGPRLFLHAIRLGFKHPKDNEWMEFDCLPPTEFNQFIDGLRQSA